MELRRANLNDLPYIVEIYNSTISSRMVTADIEPVSIDQKTDWFFQHDEHFPIWMIEINHHPVGWASLSKFHERPAYSKAAEVGLYLHEDSRHQGLGTTALKLLEQQAHDLGFKSLIALVFAHNFPSRKLFEHAGFASWGLLPEIALMDGQSFDLVILGKKIS